MNTFEIDERNYSDLFEYNENDPITFGRLRVDKDIVSKYPHIVDPNTDILNKSQKDEVLEKESKNIEQDDKQKISTIMDVKLGDIISNLSNVILNFWTEYKKMLVEVKLEMDDIVLDEKDKNITYLVKIHCQSFIRYLRKDDNSLYMGIFFILLSILLYFINIIR